MMTSVLANHSLHPSLDQPWEARDPSLSLLRARGHRVHGYPGFPVSRKLQNLSLHGLFRCCAVKPTLILSQGRMRADKGVLIMVTTHRRGLFYVHGHSTLYNVVVLVQNALLFHVSGRSKNTRTEITLRIHAAIATLFSQQMCRKHLHDHSVTLTQKTQQPRVSY